MPASPWRGESAPCRLCGHESPNPKGLAKHVQAAHGLTAFDYYGRFPGEFLARLRDTADLVENRPELGSCWEVRGRPVRRGYKTTRVAGAPCALAHRLAVWADTGAWPEDLVLHRCDVRACANPAHLRVGSHAENMRERAQRERACRGADVHTAQLDADRVRAIRELYRDGGCTYATLAAEFGVSRSAIDHVVNRRTFAWVPDDSARAGGEDFIPW